jgi:hypothetical protein
MYTDHKNLSFDNFTSDRVRHWRLIIEEYGPRIVYLPGSNNIIADALSCLPTSDTTSQNNTSSSIEHIFMSDEFFPLAFETIATAQQQDTCLQNKLLTNASYEQHIIRQNAIIYHDNKMVIPQSLQSHILDWYQGILWPCLAVVVVVVVIDDNDDDDDDGRKSIVDAWLENELKTYVPEQKLVGTNQPKMRQCPS